MSPPIDPAVLAPILSAAEDVADGALRAAATGLGSAAARADRRLGQAAAHEARAARKMERARRAGGARGRRLVEEALGHRAKARALRAAARILVAGACASGPAVATDGPAGADDGARPPPEVDQAVLEGPLGG